MTPFENIEFAFQLHFHLGFRTRYRKPLFRQAEVAAALSALLEGACGERDYHLLEHRVEPVFLRALVSLRPEHTASAVAQHLKGVLSRKAKQAHPQAFTTVTDGKVWSDGYFCRSVGRARRSVIEGYVAGQWEHHGYTAEILRAMRYRFEDSSPEGPVEICYHVALETQRRARLFTPDITDGLVAHLKDALRAQECALRAATFLPDHAHLSVRAPAKVAPADLARAILAEGWRWMTEHHPGALKLDEAWDVWNPSAYVGTMGEVTTAHVSNYLESQG